jgi:hypothetical protein
MDHHHAEPRRTDFAAMRRMSGLALVPLLLLAACGGGADESSSESASDDGDGKRRGAPAIGGACSDEGEETGGGPGVTLRCERVDGELVWTSMTVGTAPPTTAESVSGKTGGTREPTSSSAGGCGPGGITPPHASSAGTFTAAPFRATDLNLITTGKETNDPRFSYQWIKGAPGTKVPIFAPADGTLVRIRYKERNPPEFDSEDFDLFFQVSCDTVVRFNHITDPRPDIKATYQFPGQPSVDIKGGTGKEFNERQIPSTYIKVKAGEQVGMTSGTPTAHDFDFQIAIGGKTVCPFEPLSEPNRSTLLNMLGPKAASPNGPPQPGYPCEGYGQAP